MKAKQIAIGATLAAAILLMPALGAAQTEQTPINAMGYPVGVLDLGEMAFPGGNIHGRGLAMQAMYETDHPLLGVLFFDRLEINFNWDAEGTGPVWGSATGCSEDGSCWVATFAGKRERLAENSWVGEFVEVIHCISGPLEGALMMASEAIYTDQLLPAFYIGYLTGEVIIPGGN